MHVSSIERQKHIERERDFPAEAMSLKFNGKTKKEPLKRERERESKGNQPTRRACMKPSKEESEYCHLEGLLIALLLLV